MTDPVSPTPRHATIALEILAEASRMRKQGTFETMLLCWNAGELEKLAMHADGVTRQVSSLQSSLAERESRIERYQNDEASVCPEDVGFVEYITSLQASLERLKEQTLTKREFRLIEDAVLNGPPIADDVWRKIEAKLRSLSNKATE